MTKDYHDGLQSYNPPNGDDNRSNAMNYVCDFIDRKYTDCGENQLDKLTSEDDVRDALKASENGRAAGINGIPYEFWKALAAEYEQKHGGEEEEVTPEQRAERDDADIVWILTRVYQDVEICGIAPSSKFALGWLCPIHKKGDRTEMKNYRPITLLNSDYKIFTKVLAMKLAKIAPTLIHPDQAGFVPGRQIYHQIRQAQLAINYAEIGRAHV